MIFVMIGMQQIHGDCIVRVGKIDDGKTIENCDALITNDADTTLSVRVADCLPISLRDKKGHAIGIIHAGWRGLAKEIVNKTIKLMVKEFLTNPGNLIAAIGPHICQKHYEVENDVSEKFEKYKPAILEKDGKIFLDLAEIARIQLIEFGVKNENIKIDNRCTFEDLSLPSYRRDRIKERLIIKLNI